MSLKTVYQPYFRMGAAVPAQVFESTTALGELCAQYDSMTAVPPYVLKAYGNIWILPGSMA